MEKVNVKFHENNYTVSYQHKKILQFVPELSIDKNTPITTPNIPMLVSTFDILYRLPIIHSFTHLCRLLQVLVPSWATCCPGRYPLC